MKTEVENPSPKGRRWVVRDSNPLQFQQKLMLSMMSHYLFLMSCVGEAEFQKTGRGSPGEEEGMGKGQGQVGCGRE